ncbi:MAG: hypothetical protein LBH13_10005 [Cellulomonadaceae bacterium]|jgi:hypothetical protein|nr:hypothetical protein [Cellulomonadaceae bacterium]
MNLPFPVAVGIWLVTGALLMAAVIRGCRQRIAEYRATHGDAGDAPEPQSAHSSQIPPTKESA